MTPKEQRRIQRMNNFITVDFLGKECKAQLHNRCPGGWKGLGLVITCSCNCGHKDGAMTLESVCPPHSNAKGSSSQEVPKIDDNKAIC